MTTYRLMDGASGRPGVGSSGTQPPASPTPYSGGYVTGTAFKATSTVWLQGYWWWVSGSQSTAAQKFCIWSANRDGAAASATVIPASVVTSGTLSAGMNFVALPTPIPLTRYWTYVAATGWTSSGAGFPLTNSQFGSGNPYSAGITNGPLAAFSGQGGSNPDPFGNVQSSFSIAGSDPTTTFPAGDDGAFLGWLDVQVTDVAPANATYRLFPSLEGWGAGNSPDYNPVQDTDGFAVGNTFSLSQPCSLVRLWFLSGSGAVILPSRCAVWDVGNQAVVSGTDKTSPAWLAEGGGAASAGGGWCYADYSLAGVVLPSGRNMIATVYTAGGSLWRSYSIPFWGTGGIAGSAIAVGASGLGNGPLSAPSTASGTPLQGGFSGPNLAWAYPGSWDAPENDWVDVEVSPAQSFSGTGSAALALQASATGTSQRSGTGSAALSLAARATSSAPAAPASSGSWWGLYNVLEERAEYAAYYRSQVPVACPVDGTPLREGPPQREAVWYCPFDGWTYPRDYDPDIHSGM